MFFCTATVFFLSFLAEAAQSKVRCFEKPAENKLEHRSNRKRSSATATLDTSASKLRRTNRSRLASTGKSPTESRQSNSNRRSRRADDDCLLDNISLHALLADIAKHGDSWPFERPVSRSDVPDYYTVIENPMDFAKIKSKLNLGEYSSNYSMMSDIQQVFANCDLYNSSETAIYK